MAADKEEARRKMIETRKRLGPRLPRSERFRGVYASPTRIFGVRITVGPAHPTRDSP